MAQKTCSIDGCARPARARGWCTLHWQRWKAHGDPLGAAPKTLPERLCTVEGCSNGRGTSALYCEKHRARLRRHGDVTVALKDHTPAVERWKTCYEIDLATGCWNWTGPISRGYGYISNGAADSHIPAHRFVWEQVVGPILKKHVIDHHGSQGCCNKRCVNPEHLEMVPQAINALRGEVNATKTHCKHGHEFTPENTYIRANGWRACRTCMRAFMRSKNYRRQYIYLWHPGHPVADRAGKVQEHRMVLYDAIGPGPHACHWACGRRVDWGGIQGLHVDHLNGDPSDNRLENLVPSCQSCNKSRAAAGNLADWRPPGR